jgi:NAD-dependent deacetylase
MGPEADRKAEMEMSEGLVEDLSRARDILARARRVVVLTGAGISAESGVPTFRGEEGLWKTHRAEDLATPEAFARDPLLVWEWYAWRRERLSRCLPNAGHVALAKFALARAAESPSSGPAAALPPVVLVTQNVDGLHERAARDASGPWSPAPALPLELHGSIFRDRCSRCRRSAPAHESIDPSCRETLPRCGSCGGLMRPAVVWFGEALEAAVLSRAFTAARVADVCLVVGTSALVHPAASVPIATLQRGGAVLEVNPEETPLSDLAAVSIRSNAGDALPALLSREGLRM